MSECEKKNKDSVVMNSSNSSNKIDSKGPSVGSFLEIHLPEDWGTLRLWGEQRTVPDNGYEHYVVRFNDNEPGEPKPLNGNKLLACLNNEIKESNQVKICTGWVRQMLEPLDPSLRAKETVNIDWNEYSYDPTVGGPLRSNSSSSSQMVVAKQPIGQFEQMSYKRGCEMGNSQLITEPRHRTESNSSSANPWVE